MKTSAMQRKLELPADIVPGILAKLPLKSLQRFQSICRSWQSFITSPQFGKLRSKSPRLLVKYGREFMSVKLEELPEHTIDYSAAKDLGHLQEGKMPNDFLMIGSCNGFICFADYYSPLHLRLWNPSTEELRALPEPVDSFSGHAYYGFGYDQSSDDYKLVIVNKFAVQLLSLKAKSWRVISQDLLKSYDLCLDYPPPGVLLNGALHWLGLSSYRRDFGLIAFDCVEEKSKMIPLPDFPSYPSDALSGLGNFLCILTRKSSQLGGIDVWVMKDYGVKESWTKLVTLPPQILKNENPYFRPICFGKSDEIIGLLNGEIVKCNIERKSTETMMHTPWSSSSKSNYCLTVLYDERLIPLSEPEIQK